MPTHKSYCCYCGDNTYCTSPAALLDIQGTCNDAKWPPIAFCSLECFESLRNEMSETYAHALAMSGEPDNYEAQTLFNK